LQESPQHRFDPVATLPSSPASALATVAATWSALVSRARRPVGLRAELRPAARAGATVPPLSAVLDGVLAGFLDGGALEFPKGLVVLAPTGLALDESLLSWAPPRNVLLEIALGDLPEAGGAQLLLDLHRMGLQLALRTEHHSPPSAALLELFRYVMVTSDRDACTLAGTPSWILLAPQGLEEVSRAFNLHAAAVAGWPRAADPASKPTGLQPMQRAVLNVMRLARFDADTREIDRGFRAEPVLAFMLLTLANSPAIRTDRKASSPQEAIALLGHKRLGKWLSLLLVLSNRSNNTRPLVHASVVRGFAMEYLEAAAGETRARQDEAYVVGAFSLLDTITGKPLNELLAEISVPEAIGRTLLHRSGPHAAYFAHVLGFEGASPIGHAPADPYTEVAASIGLPAEVATAALLHALAAAAALLSLV
jgi:HDOD domain-containing protein